MPSSAIRRFADPYDYQASVRAADVQLLVTSSGIFQAELTRIDLHRLWMQAGRTSLPYVAHSATAKSRSAIFFLADHRQVPMHLGGMELKPGEIVIESKGSEDNHRVSTEIHWRAMSLTPDDLAAAGRALVGCDLKPPDATQVIRPPPHLMSRLLMLHQAAGELAATVPDVLAHPEVARALEQELARTMVACLSDGVVVETGTLRDLRIPVMRRFERALEANPGRPLYVTDICAAIGVADRTLRLRCMEELGMTPHRYLWLRRMHLARWALALANSATATVAAIANDHGFGELGRFAVAYRKLFGESPSATLRRQPDHLPIDDTARPMARFPVLP